MRVQFAVYVLLLVACLSIVSVSAFAGFLNRVFQAMFNLDFLDDNNNNFYEQSSSYKESHANAHRPAYEDNYKMPYYPKYEKPYRDEPSYTPSGSGLVFARGAQKTRNLRRKISTATQKTSASTPTLPSTISNNNVNGEAVPVSPNLLISPPARS